ncbi:MAG: hypothetical protein ACI4VQ_05855 [Clostridia bacterium]
MVVVEKKGEADKFATNEENKITCSFCHCEFSFKEGNIEAVMEGIPYEKGIKKLLKMNKTYIIHKYITCPWCKSKLKLKYTIDN